MLAENAREKAIGKAQEAENGAMLAEEQVYF